MSWFSVAPAAKPGENLHSVALAFDQEALFGPLVKEDTEWLCAGGFITETQIFYCTLKDGGYFMVQVIHSSVGVWYPSIQFTFRYVSADRKTHTWKSVPVTNFVPGAGNPKLDKRSVKSDQFSITLDPTTPNKYTVEGKFDDDVQVSLVVDKLAEGWKVGAGPRGGMTYFGTKAAAAPKGDAPDVAAGGDGYAVHRFWPRTAVSGVLRVGKELVDLTDTRGCFIHAIQGMRPNVLAAKWNFANFQASAESGVSLLMMEFTTIPSYGSKKVNIGSVVIGDKLVAVTAGGDGVVGGSSAEHLEPTKDVETAYDAPSSISYLWQGATLFDGYKTNGDAPRTKASLLLDLKTSGAGEAYQSKGLVEKVDVLAQIPYLIKKFVNYAAGTSPYIYTWLNPAKATISVPADLSNPSSTETKSFDVDGYIFNEATFIS
ncbi:survival factor 1 [Pseudohyphozyma bogoriensis]|nr:survival factor 1 [Pseudohyphozyma bogoriensis]